MLAAQAIMIGDAEIIVAGGMESMSNVPFYLIGGRKGLKFGNQNLVDGMIKDGLWDVYNDFHMGSAAELCAREKNISRAAQDKYAVESYQRALKAQELGLFKEEIVPVSIPQKGGDAILIVQDEEPMRVNFDKIATLKPAFEEAGTVTAANASSINDGAAAMVLMSAAKAEDLNIKPMAMIKAQASAAKAPEWFTTAPVDAIKKVLQKNNMAIEDIDLFEINEAFAVVSLAVNEILGLDSRKVNINGGAIALGHPIGASGARILVTLLYAMDKIDVKHGIASLCLGGGEASAIIISR
jgi:acetyl-CoA C-acetyltransferase